jgi:hypothetical protein
MLGLSSESEQSKIPELDGNGLILIGSSVNIGRENADLGIALVSCGYMPELLKYGEGLVDI